MFKLELNLTVISKVIQQQICRFSIFELLKQSRSLFVEIYISFPWQDFKSLTAPGLYKKYHQTLW